MSDRVGELLGLSDDAFDPQPKPSAHVCAKCGAVESAENAFGHVWAKSAIVLVCHQCGRDDTLNKAIKEGAAAHSKLLSMHKAIFETAVYQFSCWLAGGMRDQELAELIGKTIRVAAVVIGGDETSIGREVAKRVVALLHEAKTKPVAGPKIVRSNGGAP
jgi:hypothetical protein